MTDRPYNSGIARASDHGPDESDEACPAYGAELDRIQAAGFQLVRCCDHGCWECRGHGWRLPPRASALRWDDGGASEMEETQLRLPEVA